eukprot:403334285
MGNQPFQVGHFIGEQKPGQTRVLRNIRFKETDELISDAYGYKTIAQAYTANASNYPNKPFLGSREKIKTVDADGKETITFGQYQWETYGDAYKTSKAVANYLVHYELCPNVTNENGNFRFLAMYAKNRQEWIEADLGCALTSITVVTLYDTLGKEAIDYILNQTQMKVAVMTADKIKGILDLKEASKINNLTHIIYFDEASKADLQRGEELGMHLVSYQTVIEEGSSLNVKYEEPTAKTLYTISYTSGTTGMPKGVMLVQGNFMANVGGLQVNDGQFKLLDTDSYISYLPLAHVFERMMMLSCMTHRVQYGFYQGDVLKLNDDLATLKPTIMVSVPRLFTRFYDVMQAKIRELQGTKKTICEWGISTKLQNLSKDSKTTHAIYDGLVFNKFRAILGGRVRTMITGSAPISKEVLNFLKIAFCCPILEGYGQTECGAPATLTWSNDPQSGHVGSPFSACDIKLVDVPDMHYTSLDVDEKGESHPRGEVCFNGPNNFIGYYANPSATSETIDGDGWVHSGDIGTILPGGKIKIIDRKKNIFKLSQGEYVIPEKIENKLVQSLYIAQIFVYGDSLQNNLVAVVVPDKVQLEKWASENNVKGDFMAILEAPQSANLILEDMKRISKEAGFFGFEVPHKVHLTHKAFAVDNDLLTPTFKLKRNEAKIFFFNEIKGMYNGALLQGEEQ